MAPLRAKIIISFILLIVLLMLPDEATSQRRRRGMIASNTAQTDSLNRKDSLGADTVVVRVDSVAPTKKQPFDAPVIYESNDSTTLYWEVPLRFMVAAKSTIRTLSWQRK